MFNTNLLHQVQSFSKVLTKLVLPQVMHFYPFDIHVGILLVLDDIQISESLLLVPKQFTSSDSNTRIHIRVELPETDELRLGYLVHALSRLLVLASGGLDMALGGGGALWCFTLIAQTLGASVTTGIGTARATT